MTDSRLLGCWADDRFWVCTDRTKVRVLRDYFVILESYASRETTEALGVTTR